MEDFKEQYDKYISENKGNISYILQENRRKSEFDFNYDFQRNNFKSVLYIIWFLCGGIALSLLENKIILYVVISVVWIGVGLWLWISVNKYTEDIADYFFSKHQYNEIIEKYIKRDEQRDIQKLIDEMLNKEELNFVELDNYKFKLQDIEYFYNRCLSEIKHENFEEKYY